MIEGLEIIQSEEIPTQFTFTMPENDVEVTTTFFDAIYVSSNGSVDNDGLSEETAVGSLQAAISPAPPERAIRLSVAKKSAPRRMSLLCKLVHAQNEFGGANLRTRIFCVGLLAWERAPSQL